MAELILVVAGYLAGSVSFAVVASWLFRLPDPRSYGSGNPGATNVLRTGSKAAAGMTLLGDVAKGAVMVAIAGGLAAPLALNPATPAAVAVAAFLGHLYPVYFGFKGGKGVATAFGILLVLDWQVALGAALVFAAVVAATRYVSAASICAALVAPLLSAWLAADWATTVALAIIAVLVVYRHRGNIRKLLSGTENRLGAGRG